MKKEKIIIKEINNDFNSWYYDDCKYDIENNFNNDIFLIGNRDNAGINDDLIKALINELYEYSGYTVEVYYKNHYAAFILDVLKPFKKLSLKQALKIMSLLKDNSIKKDDFIINALNIMFNGDYQLTTLTGYCQSDWIVCCYNKKVIDYDYIQYIEACCFNTGVEVWISDDFIDVNELDINNVETQHDGYYDYMIDYFLMSDKKKHLASVTGYNEDQFIYYEIKEIKTYTVNKVYYKEGI